MRMEKIERIRKPLQKWVRPTLRRFRPTSEIVERLTTIDRASNADGNGC